MSNMFAFLLHIHMSCLHKTVRRPGTVNPRTKNLDFRGFDSSILLFLRGGIPRSSGEFRRNLDAEIPGMRIPTVGFPKFTFQIFFQTLGFEFLHAYIS